MAETMAFIEALTFDDVLLKPKRSSVTSRKDVDLKTTIAPGISLNIPIISANMDTVTESRLAIAMARAGGLGVIHRFLPIEAQAEEVSKVKRAENYVVDQPFTISPDATLKFARELSRRLDVQTFLVVDSEKRLLGILTKRDMVFAENEREKVETLMTPREKLITGAPNTTLEEAKEIFRKHKIEKLPLVDTTDHLVGLITARDIME
jgi:IMP dehydrogenase